MLRIKPWVNTVVLERNQRVTLKDVVDPDQNTRPKRADLIQQERQTIPVGIAEHPVKRFDVAAFDGLGT